MFAETNEEKLASRITQMNLLYNIKLSIVGEKKKSSPDRIVSYIKTIHGETAITSLLSSPYAELEKQLKKYEIEAKVFFEKDDKNNRGN